MPFTEGNKLACKSPNIVYRKLKQMYLNACTSDDILSFQDACFSIGWRPSKIAYWTTKLHVFELFKKDIQDAIISRINKNALKGNYNPTASIWRMKQLGETDIIKTDHTTNGKEISTNIIVLPAKEPDDE